MQEKVSFKNFENSVTTVKVMTKTKVTPFYLGHGVVAGWPGVLHKGGLVVWCILYAVVELSVSSVHVIQH